jgi:hypothetical protein
MAKSIGDLKQFVPSWWSDVAWKRNLLGGASHDERIKLLASLQMAIQAMDAVIAEGRDALMPTCPDP